MNEHPVLACVRAKLSDPKRPFTLLVDLEALPGRGDDVASAIAASDVVGLTRSEPGCLTYDISRNTDSPDHFIVFEAWRDLAALGRHLTTPHFAAVGAALQGLLTGAPILRVFTPTAAPSTHAPS